MKLFLTAAFILLVVTTLEAEAHRRKQNHKNRNGHSFSSKPNSRPRHNNLKGCLSICENSPVLREALINEICPDPCNGINCSNRGTCFRGRCTCVAGFSGCDCQNDINECAIEPTTCDGNATCTNTPGSFDCTCNAGFVGNGMTCADINECNGDVPCDGNATCSNTIGSFNCTCNTGFVGNGTNCEEEGRVCTTNSNMTVDLDTVPFAAVLTNFFEVTDVAECRTSCFVNPICKSYLASAGLIGNFCILFSIETSVVVSPGNTVGVCTP